MRERGGEEGCGWWEAVGIEKAGRRQGGSREGGRIKGGSEEAELKMME